jgi:prepilin-type N-terminal cleavage/methylation domain-containing protein
MISGHAHGQRGFTLIEVLIALSLFFLIMTGIFQLFGPSNVMYTAGQRKVDVQQSGRVGMDAMVRQIRMAGYFPENFDTPGTGNDIAPADRNPIQIGTGTALAIYGAANGCADANNDGFCDDPQPAGRSQVFLFCLTGNTLLSKVGAQGAFASYDCSDPAPTDPAQTRVIADNITSLTFAYFDENYNPLAAPLDGEGLGIPGFGSIAARSAVRTVVITMTSQENVAGQAPQTYTLSTAIRLRNIN